MGQVKIKMATFWGKEPRKGAFKACRKCRITDKALAMQERKGTFKGKKVNCNAKDRKKQHTQDQTPSRGTDMSIQTKATRR